MIEAESNEQEHLPNTRRLSPSPVESSVGTGWFADPDATRPGRSVGRFRVERELGRGGMGVVLLTHDLDLGRPVALKLVTDDDPRTVARFRLEANALAGLSHPNIVRVFEFGEDAGRPYLAMEFIEGRSLCQTLRAGPLEPRRAAELLAVIARAVHAAHGSGVIHRDLKPANVLLDAEGIPKITDFGIARRLDAPVGLTATDVAVGTPAYMAPEQATCGPLDARTDVYGLGATLYECLTGRPPFVGPALEVLKQVADDEPVSPRRVNRAVPLDLETVCLKCLAKEPAWRYATAAELADDLERIGLGESVLARRVGRPEQAWRWCRRHKAIASLAMIAVLSILGGTTAAVLQAYRATTARDSETVQRRVAEQKSAEAETERNYARKAEAEALADKRLAQQKADEADAINAFLLDDLIRQATSQTQSKSRFQANPNLTMREALDRAAEKVGERFRDRPATQEAVRCALGSAYLDLGLSQRAVEQLRLAFDSRRVRLGPDHSDTLHVMNGLGRAYHETGRTAEAVQLHEEGLKRCREKLGLRDRVTLATMRNLAMSYNGAGHSAKALPLLIECLRLRRENLGPSDPDTLDSMSDLAGHYRGSDRLDEALPLAEECVRLAREKLGPAHPDTLSMTNVLAMTYRQTGREAEGLKLIEACLKLSREKLGSDHPQTLSTMNTLALVYQGSNRIEESRALLEESLKLHREKLGRDHPFTLTILYNLGAAHMHLRRYPEAIPLLEECLRLSREKRGSSHFETINVMMTLAAAYKFTGRSAEALPLLEESLQSVRARWGRSHVRTRAAENNLAVVYRETGRAADAVPIYQKLAETLRDELGPDHPQTHATLEELSTCYEEADRPTEAAEVRAGLGHSLLRLNRLAEAEPHLLAGHVGLSKDRGVPPDRLAKTRRHLEELYDKWNKPAEAARWSGPSEGPEKLPLPKTKLPE